MDSDNFNSIEEGGEVAVFKAKQEKTLEELLNEINERLNTAKNQLEKLQIFLREILEINIDTLFVNSNTSSDKENKHFSPETVRSIENGIQGTESVIAKLEKAKIELENSVIGLKTLDEELQSLYQQYNTLK
ncbi:hypothetical protein COV23_02180 [Candidatus Wolfebacteria bacterium CG10_big_fil_rev_8_21_14_0_10_31_9]|uniref:Uncharacterized protein n=1 Tax=Candidatus Wolfebacteria bacterium CG10_big_fil_rev_8_21_14_0_10_31_9 TaxID=1975070 RepID=A0A2H0RD89_9BACT|nr:MAG: hypothetical protein COV23_02180 [Candidatus Wolfebacteria bacterium CG10_big_fil_rev_8_21_14_0_10_31_9]